jgi:hypothetical protein
MEIRSKQVDPFILSLDWEGLICRRTPLYLAGPPLQLFSDNWNGWMTID